MGPMTELETRTAALRGRLCREMNGAVVEAMERAGVTGPLNYGVSVPTIRAIAAETGRDHAFARHLYRQPLRELRMAAVTIADPAAVTPGELAFWLTDEPSVELLDELALKLLARTSDATAACILTDWLTAPEFRACYAALKTAVPLLRAGRVTAGVRDAMPGRVAAGLERFGNDLSVARAAVPLCMELGGPMSRWEALLPDTVAGRFVCDELRFWLA